MTAIVLIVGVTAHSLDHAFRQDRGLSGLPLAVLIGGIIAAVIALEAAQRVIQGDPRAPLVAAFVS